MADCVVITGSRDWTEEHKAVVRERLEKVPDGVLIVEGGCNGVDRLAADLCRNELQRAFLEIPAPWKKLAKGAGPWRNTAMLKLNPVAVIAFHDDLLVSKGTRNCVKAALELEIDVLQVNSKGKKRKVRTEHLKKNGR